jgi:transposase
MLLPFQAAIWFYPKPVDFRRQMDGLVILISSHLKKDPTSGQLFLFRNKHSDKIKILYWDDRGFWLCYKRLESGKFIFPAIQDVAMEITREQFSWLLSGLDFTKYTSIPKLKVSNFY